MTRTTKQTPPKNLSERDPELYRALRRTAGQPTTVQENEEHGNAARLLSFKAINSSEYAGEAPAMDIVLARQLRADLSFDLHLTSACSDRGMLSDSLQTALLLAQFIALVLPWARAAQGTTGVRASLLIAESFERTCLGSVIPANNDFFNTGKSCASGKDAFMQRGYAIQSDPTFREVLLANDSHVYLTRLANWSEAGDQDAKEVFLFVLNHELASCDSISL